MVGGLLRSTWGRDPDVPPATGLPLPHPGGQEKRWRRRTRSTAGQERKASSELFRPASELVAERQIARAIAAAGVRLPGRRVATWIAPLLASAAAVALCFVTTRVPPPSQVALPDYRAAVFRSQVAEFRDPGPSEHGPTRNRLDSPVRWSVQPEVDDVLQESGASVLDVYAVEADGASARRLELQITREASGAFTVTAASLRDALGADWPRGPTKLIFVVARPGVEGPATPQQCQDSAVVQCFEEHILVE